MKKQNFFSAMPLPLLSVLAVLVITGACQHPGGHGDDYPLVEGYGRISVQSVPDNPLVSDTFSVSDTSSRTVMPELAFDRYVYTFTKSLSNTSFTAEPDSNGFFTLETDIYTVSVSAYIGNAEPYTLVASGVSETFTVTEGDNAPVVVYLSEADTEAQGEFSYIVTYPEDAWGEITLKNIPKCA